MTWVDYALPALSAAASMVAIAISIRGSRRAEASAKRAEAALEQLREGGSQ